MLRGRLLTGLRRSARDVTSFLDGRASCASKVFLVCATRDKADHRSIKMREPEHLVFDV